MNSGQVLGVSVGASAVRVACPDVESAEWRAFRTHTVDAARGLPEELAAESIGTLLAGGADVGRVRAVGVAYRDQAQARAVQAALARRRLGNYQLVPEVAAALRMLEVSDELGDHSTLVFYDLGSSGLTVTVVERSTGTVFGTVRTDRISGELIDRLIRDHQLELHHIARPVDAEGWRALDARCRHAKEQLSTHGGAVCVPGDDGLLLLSQETFDSLLAGPVEASARLARGVIGRSGCLPDAAVLIGGGARIPLGRSVIESWLGIPAIVPEQPELVAAAGAALLAAPAVGEVTAPIALVGEPETVEVTAPIAVLAQPPTERFVKLRVRGAALAGGALAVVAAVGLGLGVGYGEGLPPVRREPRFPSRPCRAHRRRPSGLRHRPPSTTRIDLPPLRTRPRRTYESRLRLRVHHRRRAPSSPGCRRSSYRRSRYPRYPRYPGFRVSSRFYPGRSPAIRGGFRSRS